MAPVTQPITILINVGPLISYSLVEFGSTGLS